MPRAVIVTLILVSSALLAWGATTAQAQSLPRVAVVGSYVMGDGGDDPLFAGAGVTPVHVASLPVDLTSYAAVVMYDGTTADVARLQAFSAGGGGVVLHSTSVLGLCGGVDLSCLGWFGSSAAYVNDGDRATTNLANAFGTPLAAGTRIADTGTGYAAMRSFDTAKATAIATWSGGNAHTVMAQTSAGRVAYVAEFYGGGLVGDRATYLQGLVRWAAVGMPAQPPVTTATVSGTMGNNGWYRSGVSITLSCAPNCTSTKYQLDTQALRNYTGAFGTWDGYHNVTYYSTNGSATEAPRILSFKVDTLGPSCTGGYSGTLGNNGWYVRTGNETLQAQDELSGVASLRWSGGNASVLYTGPFPVTGDGNGFWWGHQVRCDMTDNAGNTQNTWAPDAPVKIDTTPPIGTLGLTCDLGAGGWCRSVATLLPGASDATSGMAVTSCTSDGAPIACPAEILVNKSWIANSPHAAVSDGNVIYLFANTDPSTGAWTDAIYRYDPRTDVLTKMNGKLPLTFGGSAVWTGSVAYIFGGYNATSHRSELVSIYDPAQDRVTLANATIPWFESGQSSVWDGHQVWLVGNFSLARYDPATDTSTLIGGYETFGAKLDYYPHALAWDGKAVYILGGGLNGPSGRQILRFDPVTSAMTALNVTFPRAAVGGGAIWDGTRIDIFFLDYNSADGLQSLYRFEPTTESVTETVFPWRIPSLPVWDGAQVWLMGGTGYPSDPSIVRYTPATPWTVETGSHTICVKGTDRAGNVAAPTCATAKIDTKPPTVMLSPAACTYRGSLDWCRDQSVPVTVAASDDGSGVSTTTCTLDAAPAACTSLSVGQGVHVVCASAIDVAGNQAPSSCIEVKTDSTQPALSFTRSPPPNSFGWNNGSVRIHWTCTDATSGVASMPADQVYASEGASQVVSGVCTDVAGNSIQAGLVGIDIDLSAPVFDAASDVSAIADAAGGGHVTFAIPSASDTLSGVRSTTCDRVSGAFFPLGSTTVTCSATDRAGNSATTTFHVSVSPGPLSRISVQGPTSLVANTSARYDLAGFDAYGNAVALALDSLDFQAPTTAGPATVPYAENGVTGALDITVGPDALASIEISGPASIAAGATQSFALAGFDQFGNDVALSQNALAFAAPEQVGVATVSYTEGGVTGTLSINVIADKLATIAISGPETLVAGTQADYALAGFDRFHNEVALTQASLTHRASLSVGRDDVCYQESDVSACIGVAIVHDALASIKVRGPASLVAGTAGEYALAGFDQYGNEVPLAQRSLSFRAPSAAGTASVTYAEEAIQGSEAIEIVHDALAVITVEGPGEVVVGSTATYALAGFDQYGNSVPLAQAAADLRAPTAPGDVHVTYAENDITGDKLVHVVHGDLSTIVVSGPGEMIVDTTATFAAEGHDPYGNSVPISTTTFSFTAPTTTGSAAACITEDAVTGCKTVTITPGALARIVITGPTTIVAGESVDYALAGFDAYANAVDLAQPTLTYVASTRVGSTTIRDSEQGIDATLDVAIVAGPLASIQVSGPTALVATASATYALAGSDQYGNDVPLARTTLDFQASTRAGSASVSYTEQEITGILDINVVADRLARIDVAGPTTIVAGRTQSYALSGFDRFDNDVPLAQRALDVVAPTQTGLITVTYSEGDVTGSLDVAVTHDALATISLSGPLRLHVNQTATYSVAGADAYGNAVPLNVTLFAFEAPDTAGPNMVCYDEQGVRGCITIEVTATRTARIEISAPLLSVNVGRALQLSARTFDSRGNPTDDPIVWNATRDPISADGLFTGARAGSSTITASVDDVNASVRVLVTTQLNMTVAMNVTQGALGNNSGTVHLTYVDGAPTANATVTISIGPAPVSGLVPVHSTVTGTTDANGDLTFSLPTQDDLPGTYGVDVRAAEGANSAIGHASYTIPASQ